MTQLHKDVGEADMHEPKGMSTASINSIYRAIGGGTGSWEPSILVDPADLVGNAGDAVIVNATEDGIDFAKFAPVLQITGQSLVDQNPVALDTPLQIEFGAQQISTNVTLDADGLVTFDTVGDYQIALTTQVGRSGSSGTAWLFSRILFQGVQQGAAAYHVMDSSTDTIATNFVFSFSNPVPGLTFSVEILRDSQGTDDGGLLAASSGVWGPASSSNIRVSKYEAI